MSSSRVATFTDPHAYAASIRATDNEILVTARGEYRAELTRIDLHKLWMQRGRESLPRIARAVRRVDRSMIFFASDSLQAPSYRSGVEVLAGDIVFNGSSPQTHHRSVAGCRWGAMSLTPEDLAAAGRAIVGYDVTAPVATKIVRPPSHLMSQLMKLHQAAGDLAETAPEILAHPEVAKAIEQALVRAMIACLTSGTTIDEDRLDRRSVMVMQRFEEALEANQDHPLYLTELCAIIGVTDRSLRLHCQEHLGMSPHRYLWLRRMHQARRALVLADRTAATVTEIATGHGFGELGRFAVEYRKLFGETPSATLRRQPDNWPIVVNSAFR